MHIDEKKQPLFDAWKMLLYELAFEQTDPHAAERCNTVT